MLTCGHLPIWKLLRWANDDMRVSIVSTIRSPSPSHRRLLQFGSSNTVFCDHLPVSNPSRLHPAFPSRPGSHTISECSQPLLVPCIASIHALEDRRACLRLNAWVPCCRGRVEVVSGYGHIDRQACTGCNTYSRVCVHNRIDQRSGFCFFFPISCAIDLRMLHTTNALGFRSV